MKYQDEKEWDIGMPKRNSAQQYKRKNYIFPVALSIVLMAGAALGVAYFWQKMQDSSIAVSSAEPSSSSVSVSQVLASELDEESESVLQASEQAVTSKPDTSASEESESESEPESKSESKSTSGEESGPGDFYPRREDYPYALKASDKVLNSYFDDAIFFGDSISTGIMNYNVMPNADVVAFIGISTVNALTKECIETDNGVKTMLDAAKALGDKKKVYIMLGGNGLGYDKETFTKGYKSFINAVKEQYPGAHIYVQTMPPVTDYAHKTYPTVSNAVINEFNLEIHDMAKDTGVILVDTACAFMNEDGKLPDTASPVDGMHFGPEYYHRWFEYLKAHTAKSGQ